MWLPVSKEQALIARMERTTLGGSFRFESNRIARPLSLTQVGDVATGAGHASAGIGSSPDDAQSKGGGVSSAASLFDVCYGYA
jgi:hypothetical protein